MTDLQEAATRGVEAISLMVAERDAFRARNEKLEVDCALMSQEIESLKQRLILASAERDHYMRHSVELTSRLNNIQIVINETVREAQIAAYRPPVVPGHHKPDGITRVDQEQLESLIAKLPVNGGERD